MKKFTLVGIVLLGWMVGCQQAHGPSVYNGDETIEGSMNAPVADASDDISDDAVNDAPDAPNSDPSPGASAATGGGADTPVDVVIDVATGTVGGKPSLEVLRTPKRAPEGDSATLQRGDAAIKVADGPSFAKPENEFTNDPHASLGSRPIAFDFRVAGITPERGAQDVAVAPHLAIIAFTQAVDPSTLNADTVLVEVSRATDVGNLVLRLTDADLEASDDGTSVTITVKADSLAHLVGARVKISLTSGILSENGDALEAFEAAFRMESTTDVFFHNGSAL